MFRMTAYFLICMMLTPFTSAFDDGDAAVDGTGSDPIQVEVHLVNIEARVTQNGEPVRGLTKDDFLLKESGKEQEIAFFYYVEAPASIRKTGDQTGSLESLREPGPGENHGAAAAPSSAEADFREPDVADPTWMHLVVETADPAEFGRTAKAIRQFIEQEMQPGFYVSLAGMPFTDNKEMLLSTLDRLEGKPFGPGSGVDPAMLHLKDLEMMRDIALAIPFAPDIEAIEDALQTTAVFEGPIDQAPLIGVETVNRQIRFFGELAILRYMDLVERMALLPGRKSIVVFRSGLMLDNEIQPILDRLLSMANRNRVSFYTVDSLGLDVIPPVNDIRYPLAWSRGRLQSYLPDVMKETTRRREAEEGLVVLARETGGYAVLDSNDMGSVLSRAAEDSFSYYVLGYYPENFSNNGRFRKIALSIKDDRKYDIATVRGYAEPRKLRLQSRAERLVSLRKSLQMSESGDLNIQVEPEIFAGPDGSPILFVSAGASAGEFDLKKGSRESRVEGEILIQIVNSFSQKIPLYHNGKVDEVFDNSLFEGSSQPVINYQTVLPLSPGLYELRVIIRDSRSGKFGVKSSTFLVSNFRSASVPSSLLMTRYTTSGDTKNIEADDWYRIVLSAGGTGYYPQPSAEFRQGEIIHVLFHLYHPTAEDREWADKGMQIGVFRENIPVTDVRAQGQVHMDSAEDVIRYSAMVDTSTLGPGSYSLLALLPNYETRKVPHLEEFFSVVGQ